VDAGIRLLVARLALREGIRDVSFRFSGRRGASALLVAWLYPAAVGLAAYGFAWAAGMAVFTPPEMQWLGLKGTLRRRASPESSPFK
jgi:hypothetical protein